MEKGGEGPNLSDGFRWLDQKLRQTVEDQVREQQVACGPKQERAIQELEERLLSAMSSQTNDLRQELWSYVDEQRRLATARQTELEDMLLRSFQERALQLHKSWTVEQDGAVTLLRKQGDELRASLSKHVDMRLQQLSSRQQALEVAIGERATELRELKERRQRSESGDDCAASRSGASSAVVAAPAVSPARARADSKSSREEMRGVALEAGTRREVSEAGENLPLPSVPPPERAATPPSADTVSATAVTKISSEPDGAVGALPTCSEQVVEEAAPLLPLPSESECERIAPIIGDGTPTDIDDADASFWYEEVVGDAEGVHADLHARSKPRPSLWMRKRILWPCTSLLLGVVAACWVKPYLTAASILVIILWMLFLCGEEPTIRMISARAQLAESDWCKKKLLSFVSCLRLVQSLRSSHEKEKTSRAVLYTVCILVCVLNPDATSIAPLLFVSFGSTWAILILVAAASVTVCIAHLFVAYVHHPTLRRRQHAGAEDHVGSEAAKAQLQAIKGFLLQRRGNSEKKIMEIFRESDGESLNELLVEMSTGACSLANVILFFNDEPSWQARSEFLRILCVDRCNDLNVRSKSVVLDALLMMKLSSCEYGEGALANLLLSASGDELSELKSMQDSGNVHSIHKLVYQDITNSRIRDQLLDHFLAEGLAQVAHRALLASPHFVRLLDKGRRRGCIPEDFRFIEDKEMQAESQYHGRCGHAWLKVFTDIDDTLECSGGRWPAGIDARYPRHTPYPGVTAFYKELQGGGSTGQLVALSARPHVVGTVVEETVMKKFEHLKAHYGLHCMPALLPGAIDAGTKFLVSGGSDEGLTALAQKKYEKFIEFLRLYPEFRLVFIGDNGQADWAVGQMMCRKYPQHVEQVWIHEVQAREKTFRIASSTNEKLPIDFVENFVDAAVQAATRRIPLITPEGLHRVVKAAVTDYRRVPTWPSEEVRVQELHALSASIEKARAVLLNFGIEGAFDVLADAKCPSEQQPDKTPPISTDQEPASPKEIPQDVPRSSWWRSMKERTKTSVEGTPKSPLQAQPISPSSGVNPQRHSQNLGADSLSPKPAAFAELLPTSELALPETPELPENLDVIDSAMEQQSTTKMLLQWVRTPEKQKTPPSDTNASVDPASAVPAVADSDCPSEQVAVDEPDAEPVDAPSSAGCAAHAGDVLPDASAVDALPFNFSPAASAGPTEDGAFVAAEGSSTPPEAQSPAPEASTQAAASMRSLFAAARDALRSGTKHGGRDRSSSASTSLVAEGTPPAESSPKGTPPASPLVAEAQEICRSSKDWWLKETTDIDVEADILQNYDRQISCASLVSAESKEAPLSERQEISICQEDSEAVERGHRGGGSPTSSCAEAVAAKETILCGAGGVVQPEELVDAPCVKAE